MQSTRFFYILFFVIGCLGQTAFAQNAVKAYSFSNEKLGEFEVDSFAIQTEWKGKEKQGSQFQWVHSYLGFNWKKEDDWLGHLSISSSDLRRRSVFFSPAEAEEAPLQEAYVQKSTEYFNLFMGRKEIPFFRFQKHLGWSFKTVLEDIGLWTKSDWGLGLYANHKAFETEFMIYNGEGGADQDKRLWFSGEWKYENEYEFGVMISGQTGETDVTSTANSKAASLYHFGFDPNAKSKIRMTNLMMFKKWNHSRLWWAITKGDILQSDGISENKKSFQHAMVEAQVSSGEMAFYIRHENWQPNFDQKEFWEKRASLGFRWTSKDNLVSGYIGVTKIFEESDAVANDEGFLGIRVQSDWIK